MKETYSRESKVAIKALNNFTKKYIFMDSLDSPNTLLVCASPDIPPKEANKETKTIFIGSMSIVGVGFFESRSTTVFRVTLMFGSIIHIFGHA